MLLLVKVLVESPDEYFYCPNLFTQGFFLEEQTLAIKDVWGNENVNINME